MQKATANLSVRSALRTCRSALLGIFLVSAVLNILMLTGPMFMLQVYDRVLASNSVPTLVVLSGIALALYLFSGLLDILRSQALSLISLRVHTRLSVPAFFAGVQLPLLMGRKAGSMEPIRDLDHVKRFLGSSGPAAIFDLPFMPFYFALLFLFHPWLGVLAAGGGIVIFVLVVTNEITAREPARDLVTQTSAQLAVVTSARRNAEVLRAMGMFDSFAHRFGQRLERSYGAQRRVADRSAFFASITKTLRLLLQSAMLGLGAYLAILQEISPGVMIAASIIMARALSPIEQAVANWPTFVAARQAAARLKELLGKSPPATGMKDMPLPTQNLAVAQLATAAPGEPGVALQGINLSLEAGDGLGVIGPSGSGKTSFVRALVGVWPTVRGSVRLDGATLDQWTDSERGRFIGYLPQDVELFEGTVAENIARFAPDPPVVEIIRAAKLAGVHGLITSLPDGYNCMIGEAGARLSAGQRQRIGLARALFGKPFLIVLDEPNSNLDAEGERALSEAVLEVRKQGSIVVMVAHRSSALSAVNKMLVIRDGQQVDFGPRDKVLTSIAPVLVEGGPRRTAHA
ncbi:type I secretion protein [Agaricicola taiwanensis]|uniref:Type I secretion protein n=1 Tax=Agaricicola taiwanensis TaxID=591372 RepID=A0A8J2VM50_9RHOB|nr:type I secretion system permease/ATPase [Agaricicola taiwanensis]GGE31792.1 type I secretion protein [Agaricicola taiwanensis]